MLRIFLLVAVLLIVCILLGYFVLRNFLCIVFIEGTSMVPTLHPRERVLVLYRNFRRILRKQQIVVITPYGISPFSNSEAKKILFSHQAFIKRLTTVGEGVQEVFPYDLFAEDRVGASRLLKDGNTYIPPEDREYMPPLKAPERTPNGGYLYEIPLGYVFVLSDNRTAQTDSRLFGPIPQDAVLGIVIARFP